MAFHHHILTIPGGADLPPEFLSQVINKMAHEWQSRKAKGYRTFADPVEDTVPEWIKRRDANINIKDKAENSTQQPSEEASTYSCACCTLRMSLHGRDATAEDFKAFLSTAAPQALPEESLLRLRAIFLIDASSSALEPGQIVQVDKQVLRRASVIMIMALEALHFAKKLVVVEVLEKANLEAFGAKAGKRVHGGERLPEGDPDWLKQNMAEFGAYVAQSKGSVAEKVIEKSPGILKAAKAELDGEPYYKLMWHFAGVEILDDENLNRVITEYRENDEEAHESTVGTKDEAARMTALAKHISTLDAKTLGDIFGDLATSIKEDIEADVLAPILIRRGEAGFNSLCMLHGGVEGVLKIKESAFVSKIPTESPHLVGHKENPEHIVLDLARLGMAGGEAGDSVSKGMFMSLW